MPDPGSPGAEPPVEERSAVLAALRRRAEPDGFVPNDRFMEVALYAASVGYYARARSPFGPGGDFYTAPRVGPLYARTLAARVAEIDRALGRRRPFAVVDLGAGDGLLLRGLAEALPTDLDLVAVDRSPARREESASSPRIRAVGSFAELGPCRGVVVAHELLDAQPARRLRWDGDRWEELGVLLGPEGWSPAARPAGTSVPGSPVPELRREDAGRVVELAPAAEAIVREVADHLGEGVLIVVDYGAEGAELRAAHPHGTFEAVRGHRAGRSPLAAVGASDLSTFVDFSRVREAARRAGWVELAYRGQAEALGAWGFESELRRTLAAATGAEEEVRLRLAAKNLLFGFGTFRVLELATPTGAAALARITSLSQAGSS